MICRVSRPDTRWGTEKEAAREQGPDGQWGPASQSASRKYEETF